MTEILHIQHVVSDEADRRWDEFAPFIAKAMAYAHADVDIREQVRLANMGLFEAVDDRGTVKGCLTVQLLDVELSKETVLRIILMADINLASMERAWPMLEAIARNNNAVAIECFGRKGFERWAKSLNLKPIYTVFRAEVPHV